jgi:hypothetical protein
VARKPKRRPKAEEPLKSKHENPVKRFAEEVETHLMEGAELATSTTSAETNVAMAALGVIEGPGESKPKAGKKPAKPDKTRPKAR